MATPIQNPTVERMVDLLHTKAISQEVFDRFLESYDEALHNIIDVESVEFGPPKKRPKRAYGNVTWTTGLDNALIHLYSTNMSLSSISDILKVSYDAVRYRRNSLNLPIRPVVMGNRSQRRELTKEEYETTYPTRYEQKDRRKPMHNKNWTPELDNRLLSLDALGRSIGDIANIMNISYKSVRCRRKILIQPSNSNLSRLICRPFVVSVPNALELCDVQNIKVVCLYHSIEATKDECFYGKSSTDIPTTINFTNEPLSSDSLSSWTELSSS